jgi:hypothetical protein
MFVVKGKISIDREMLLEKIANAWAETTPKIAAANQQAIKAQIYDWPNLTRRSSGEVVGSPRDIVDTATLLQSQSIVANRFSARLHWSADYAYLVHEGTSRLPGRPWTRYAIAGAADADSQWINAKAFLHIPTALKNSFK